MRNSGFFFCWRNRAVFHDFDKLEVIWGGDLFFSRLETLEFLFFCGETVQFFMILLGFNFCFKNLLGVFTIFFLCFVLGRETMVFVSWLVARLIAVANPDGLVGDNQRFPILSKEIFEISEPLVSEH